MRSGVRFWNADDELELTDDTCEDIAHSLRTVLNQLLNMKSGGRPIPKLWKPKFCALYAMLQCDAPGTDCELEIIEQGALHHIDVSSDDNAQELFQGADPELQRLLGARQ